MSMEQIDAFKAKLLQEPALQAELRTAGRTVADIVAMGRREGFSFTEAELQAYLDSTAPTAGQELTAAELDDEALELVAAAGLYGSDGGCHSSGADPCLK